LALSLFKTLTVGTSARPAAAAAAAAAAATTPILHYNGKADGDYSLNLAPEAEEDAISEEVLNCG
jgi:hypothetical protein